ncbi:hypothetical protein AYI69_g3062 [Smittium culicis]|uniref:Uncharacterized protein n=1 Tax=Smittium culicis TaxID=133412 RepID=A0A1R1YKQ8_9FUNG|nr:hypothetical protein AYI69_g3062 [Smittium culicis]
MTQVTIPIDYFVHRQILDIPKINKAEEPEATFSSTMYALLSDISKTKTYSDPNPKLLMDQEVLDNRGEIATLSVISHVPAE